jgi:hypothetical protein
MGFYIRKSLRFGPIRFNLSGSGVGMSVGVKGFRVGTGPRGNYVHAGAAGLYYRATIPNARRPETRTIPDTCPQTLTEIESGTASAMVDETDSGVLLELNRKRCIFPLLPAVLVSAGLTLSIYVATQQPVWAWLALFLALIGIPAWYLDRQRKTSIVFYEIEEPVQTAIQSLHAAFDSLGNVSSVWHVAARGATANLKYNAGADWKVQRSRVRLGNASPPYFKTNVAVACLPAGRQKLYFLPDRLLVYDHDGIGSISYAALEIDIQMVRFVEEGAVPRDSAVVGKTWRYVNKKGGPDRRFAENPEIPILLYDQITFRSASGLNEQFQVSRTGGADHFRKAIRELANSLSTSASGCGNSSGGLINSTTSQPLSQEDQYYYFLDVVYGPVSAFDLVQLADSGTIAKDTLICSAGDHQWGAYAQMQPRDGA